MNPSRMRPASRPGRAALGLTLGVASLAAASWMVHEAASRPALAFVQIASGKPKVPAAQVLARFPRERHETFLRRAIANSRKAGVEYKTGGAFGAVIVDARGEVLADGVNHVIAQNDPTWHGEMDAIRRACALLKKPKLDGCLLYTSAEPCPMCLATAYWAGLDGIIYGATYEDAKKYGNFDDAFILAEFAKPTGDRAISQQSLLRKEAVDVWKEYAARKDRTDY